MKAAEEQHVAQQVSDMKAEMESMQKKMMEEAHEAMEKERLAMEEALRAREAEMQRAHEVRRRGRCFAPLFRPRSPSREHCSLNKVKSIQPKPLLLTHHATFTAGARGAGESARGERGAAAPGSARPNGADPAGRGGG